MRPLTLDDLVFTEVYVRAAGASQSISGEGSNAPPATRGPLLAKTGKMQMKPLAPACMALSVLMIASFAQAEGNNFVPSAGNAERTMTEQMSGNKGSHLRHW